MATLPFYPEPIPDNAIDLTPTPVDFTDDIPGTLGNLGTADDGVDQLLLTIFTDLATVPNLTDALDIDLLGIGGAFGDLATPWEQGFSDSLTSAITGGDPDFQQLNVDLTANTPPASGGGPPSGGGTVTTKCGTYGQSSILLSDPTGNCYAADTLPKVNIPDGACAFPFLMDGSQFPGRTGVSSAQLTSGDSQLWHVAVDTVTPQGATAPVSRVTFTLTPYKTGHFDGKFLVQTTRNPGGEIWCLIVDVIDTTTATGGGGGGGATGSGGGGTGGGGSKSL